MIFDPLTHGLRYFPESVADVERQVRLVRDVIEVLDPHVEYELAEGQVLIAAPDFAFPPQTIGPSALATEPGFGAVVVT